MKRRILSVVMAVVIMVSVMPIIPNTVSAISPTTSGTIEERIGELQKLYPNGSYFSANGGACGHGMYDVCSNCNFRNIESKKFLSVSPFTALQE